MTSQAVRQVELPPGPELTRDRVVALSSRDSGLSTRSNRGKSREGRLARRGSGDRRLTLCALVGSGMLRHDSGQAPRHCETAWLLTLIHRPLTICASP